MASRAEQSMIWILEQWISMHRGSRLRSNILAKAAVDAKNRGPSSSYTTLNTCTPTRARFRGLAAGVRVYRAA